MSQMEERLNAILSNPQLMQQIASIAQNMGNQGNDQAPEQKEEPAMHSSAFDPKLLQTMAQTMGQMGIDNDQQALLQALRPFLSHYRVQKLERAMQAARLAGAASSFLSAGGLQMLTGR